MSPTNGFPVNVLSNAAKLALDDVVKGAEARKDAMKAIVGEIDDIRVSGWQTVGPLAFKVIRGLRKHKHTVPLGTMIRLRKRWESATDSELAPIIMRDTHAELGAWITTNLEAILGQEET